VKGRKIRATPRRTGISRLLALIIVIWLIIGSIAAAQRHYFSGSKKPTCAKVSTTVVTVIAGPLNYVGVNPKIKCNVPQPSK
jgi:membrane protein YdbS with pleckstrin-like domain